MVKQLVALCLVICISLPAHAAPGSSAMSGPRKQLSTIVFTGLAGAILGLSTLSFYGRPQDKLSNIAIGFAIGIITGTIYTTYQTTTKPHEYYDTGLTDSETWQQLGQLDSSQLPSAAGYTAPLGGYSWEF